jgi:subfamily B ATP-binding cassette protein MsbA
VKIPAAPHVLAILARDRKLVARLALSSLGRSALSMATIVLMQQFLAGVLGGTEGLAAALAARYGTAAALWIAAALLLACYLAMSVTTYDTQVVEQKVIRAVELGIIERLIRHLLTLSVDFYDRHGHGDLIQAIRQDVTQLRIIVSSLARMVLDGFAGVALLATAVWVSPRLAFWVLLVFPLVALPVLFLARLITKRSFRVRRQASVLYDVILQILRGIRVIKIFRGEEQETARTVAHARRYFEACIEIARTESLGRVFLESLAGLSVVVVVIAGGFQVLGGTLSWPSLLAFLMAVRAALGPLNSINTSYLEIQRYRASAVRISELLEERPKVTDRADARPLERPPDRIRFDHVSFAYESTEVLSDICFEVESGETLGIVGPSGCGKTTLLCLAARLFDPSAGRVRLDGEDIRAYRLSDVYRLVALVPQEPFLFCASVRDNIRCGRPGATDAEVEAAARAAEIHDEILELPEGYETVLGTGGRSVSEGQAQRLNIARALLKNAPILLLDEATSSLDSISESKVQRAIDSLVQGRTTFVVAHRLSTLRNAGRILVLDRGRQAGLGSHGRLLQDCELYREMWRPQESSAAGSSHDPLRRD